MINYLVYGFLLNIAINALIGSGQLLALGLKTVPLFGSFSIASDLVSMTFMLTFCVSWFYPHTLKKKNRLLWVLGLSVIFTLISFPILGLMILLNITMMTFIEFVIFKSIFAGILAMVVMYYSKHYIYS